MKFLEAVKQDGRKSRPSLIPEENKMQPGNRPEQQAKMDPADLVSSPSRAFNNPSRKNAPAVPPATRADVVALAKELDVDLHGVKGTGKDGEVMEKDVRTSAREKM